MRIYILCVLYNDRISNIKSLDNFLKLGQKYPVTLVVEDNSNQEFWEINKKEYTDLYDLYKDKIIYNCNRENLGLSKAYNKAIDRMNVEDYVLLADDDTYFSEEYLKNAFDAVMDKDAEIVSGIVYNKIGCMSPLKKLMLKNTKSNFITEPGKYNNVYCINSGLMYRVSLLREIGGYNENLFLDMVDYWFMERLMDLQKNNVLIVPGKILQDFSGADTKMTQLQIKQRFAVFKKDFMWFCRARQKTLWFLYFFMWKRKLNIMKCYH